ncbi:carbohydrate porin [Pseudoalteromonas fenneropenaei]|uniref:Carbohydrate porin n=1 Tax=Pseudoalteromonas fenneropenaei TaxID=1737459 RepID=A0ABV7CHZ8_9GAMM
MRNSHSLALAATILATSSGALANANELAELKAQLQALQKRISQLEQQATQQAETPSQLNANAIKVGGAVRTNFSSTSYDDDSKNRGGDFDFDMFRIDFSGKVGDIGLNAELRVFDYMTAIKFAYLSYDINRDWQAQLGLTKVPFGNWPYNSHSYFFSTNYYLGLEDDHDLGILFKRQLRDNWQLDLGFFKNDELGGVDGYVEDRTHRYSYDIVGLRAQSEGIYATPSQAVGEYNTFAGRIAYVLPHKGGQSEWGLSALAGGLHDGTTRVGDYSAWAVHFNGNYGPWNVQLQHGKYDYDVTDVAQVAVGAYAFYDSIAAAASMSSFNVAYAMKVNWGPVQHVQFYNDFGMVYSKSDGSADTWMNVTGMSFGAGAFFSYFDIVHAKNQPFIGGSIAGDSDDTERRYNLNFGYYF